MVGIFCAVQYQYLSNTLTLTLVRIFSPVQVAKKGSVSHGKAPAADTKWSQQAVSLRQQLPWDLRNLKPWSKKARMQGLNKSARQCEMLDLAYLHVQAAREEAGLGVTTKEIISDLFVDTSQALVRKPWGFLRTLTTSSAIYSFERDRLLLPHECLRMLGFSDFSFTDCLSNSELSDAVGCAMALPSVALPALSLLLASHDELQLPDLFDHQLPRES